MEPLDSDVTDAEAAAATAARNSLWLIAIAVLLVALIVIAALTLLTLIAVRDNVEATRANTDALVHNTGLVVDCTTPGGRCYQDGQERAAEALRQLNDADEARTQQLLAQVNACNLDAAQCSPVTTVPPGDAGP